MKDASERVLELDDHSPSARLVYLALRDNSGGLSADELADAVGISRPAAHRVADELVDDSWARKRTREQPDPGPSPAEWQPLVSCRHCEGRFHPCGLKVHESGCDDNTITARDVSNMDPEDLGLGGDAPEPTGGLR